MRSMTIFNFLLEASVIGSVLILLVIAVRALLRERLGSRAIYAAWFLVAVRLLLPLSLPNPAMDEFRPGLSTDVEARPVADQVRQRVIDAGLKMSDMVGDNASGPLRSFALQTSSGNTGKWILMGWAVVALCVAAWMLARGVRFFRRVRRDRVSELQGERLERYRGLCARYGVKPLPVYYVDKLSDVRLVGVFRRFIAVPVDLPEEQLTLLLAHEICHQRTHAPLWNVIRSLCLILHWFNPLVWLAAYLSRVDCEMACDDRVTSKLQDIDRLAYANVIVSASERAGGRPSDFSLTGKHLRQRITSIIRSVRVNRWGVILRSLAAAIVLVISFATSESEPLPTVTHVPEVSWTASVIPLNSAEEAVACAMRFMQSPFVGENTTNYHFTAAGDTDGWRVEARATADTLPIVLRFSRDGYVLEYDGTRTLDGLSFTDNTYTHRTFTDSVDEYICAFMAALVPGQTWSGASATADVRAGQVRLVDGILHDETGTAVCEVTLQVEPGARVLYFRTFSPAQANG